MILSLLTGSTPTIPQIPLIPPKEPPAIVKELTTEEKIKTNFYKCDTNTQWIRADNAQCLPKTQVATETPPEPIKNTPSDTSNTYERGQCTWYAKSKRPDLPNNLGNANTWVERASAQGIATGSTPRAGAIGQQGMHVVYIEAVNNDGTVYLSEMNYDYNGGFRYRTANASDFMYIY